jgi:hypothetical protein
MFHEYWGMCRSMLRKLSAFLTLPVCVRRRLLEAVAQRSEVGRRGAHARTLK